MLYMYRLLFAIRVLTGVKGYSRFYTLLPDAFGMPFVCLLKFTLLYTTDFGTKSRMLSIR